MKLGFSLPMAGPWATPDNQVLIAQRAKRSATTPSGCSSDCSTR